MGQKLTLLSLMIQSNVHDAVMTYNVYDALNRLTSKTDNAGNQNEYRYDSRKQSGIRLPEAKYDRLGIEHETRKVVN